jgi:Mg/Co/Ni transporter MgtE
MLARNSIHAMQGELETLKTGRAQYAHDPYGLIAASHVVAVEFATIAAANTYWMLVVGTKQTKRTPASGVAVTAFANLTTAKALGLTIPLSSSSCAPMR